MFIVGFCLYITIEVLFRGYSFALMGLCGAIAFLLIDKLNSYISWDMDLILQGCIGSVIITTMELFVGLLDKYYLHINMWSYSNLPYNYQGVICLEFSLIWILISIVAVLLADAINYYVFNTPDFQPYYKVFGKKIFQFKAK